MSPALNDPRPAAPRRRRRGRVDAAPSLEHTDALLVAAGRGDLNAFAAFYDRTAQVVFGMLHGVLGHPARAERATEDVYLQLWRAAPEFDPVGCSAWAMLMVTTRRTAVVPPSGGTA